MNKSRPNKVTFRLSDSELEALNGLVKNSGYNTQQFLTRAIFESKVVNKESLYSILNELRKQGVNLNQIARACNAGNQQYETERIEDALRSLRAIWQYLRRLT